MITNTPVKTIRVRQYRLIPANSEAVQVGKDTSEWAVIAAWCGGRVTTSGIWVPNGNPEATAGDYIAYIFGEDRFVVMRANVFKKTFRQFGIRQDGFDYAIGGKKTDDNRRES